MVEKNVFVKDLVECGPIETTLAVYSMTTKVAKTGKKYVEFRLGDKTGVITARHWTTFSLSADDICSGITPGCIIHVNGLVDEFPKGSGKFNVSISPEKGGSIKLCNALEYDLADFRRVTDKDRDLLLSEIKASADSVGDEHLKRLLSSFFNDPDFIEVFKESPAAESNHHNCIGGLMEHILGVIRLSETLCKYYEGLNRDLLITGAILHDIGKLGVYTYTDTSIGRTEEGNLIEHIVLGDRMVHEKISNIPDFPKELENRIHHLMLSHHGDTKNGWGSVISPQIPEATALHYADLLDSQVKGRLQKS